MVFHCNALRSESTSEVRQLRAKRSGTSIDNGRSLLFTFLEPLLGHRWMLGLIEILVLFMWRDVSDPLHKFEGPNLSLSSTPQTGTSHCLTKKKTLPRRSEHGIGPYLVRAHNEGGQGSFHNVLSRIRRVQRIIPFQPHVPIRHHCHLLRAIRRERRAPDNLIAREGKDTLRNLILVAERG